MKKLLIIGATAYFIDVIRAAKEMGVYTIMTDFNPDAIAKPYADESYDIDTTDKEAILNLAIRKKVDGVFVGWSDANLYTAYYVCKELKLPFYSDKEQLDISINKDRFKNMCENSGVMTTKRFDVSLEDIEKHNLKDIEYPVIVKPVDNGGTRGITVCDNDDELAAAYRKALEYSYCRKVIVEEFLENEGRTVSVKYLIRDGEPKLLCVGDRYVLDPVKGRAMITNVAFYPSKLTKRYMETQNMGVVQMLKSHGFKNGQLFIEGIPTPEGIKFYEMGYRLSGGITYRITDRLTGISGMKMLINYALTGNMCDDETFHRIDPFLNDGCACSYAILMNKGRITAIEGIDDIKAMEGVMDVTQYYHEGDEVEDADIGNIGQMFARLSVIAPDREGLLRLISEIEDTMVIRNQDGENMCTQSKILEVLKDDNWHKHSQFAVGESFLC